MILTFADSDGDPVAVESAAIVGLSVGAITRPHRPDVDVTVTLIWCAGAAQPFLAATPFAEVLEAWTAARTAGPPAELKGMHGWPMQYPHPASVLPGAPAWSAKGGRP